MDYRNGACVSLLISLSLLLLQSRADAIGSVLFLDSPTHNYLRTASDGNLQTSSVSLMEVGAAVSVLLGSVPPATLSAASSSKLNEILMPNPFDRPRHVFVLEVRLAEDSQVMVHSDSSTIKRRVTHGQDEVQVELPDGVSFISLDGTSFDSLADVTDKDISEFATWIGGTYSGDSSQPLNGEMIVSLPSGQKMSLHMSKKAEKDFTASLISLVNNVRKALCMHQSMYGSNQDAAELVRGYFDGIKALESEYGPKGIVQQGAELFLVTVSKIFDTLQEARKGEIVGVILFSEAHSPQPKNMLDVTFASWPSARLLDEVKAELNSTVIAEVVLVRRTLAWITGIIVLIATLIGVYLLVNMPLTKDTLLYSNVKLD